MDDIPLSSIQYAFLLTVIAGLCTGIGSLIAFCTRRTNTRFLSVALGFSAGVMIYVSFVELLEESKTAMISELGEILGTRLAVGAFFAGILITAVIDRLIPYFENPHEVREVEDMDDKSERKKFRKLYRMGVFSAVAIAFHNFPEGLATFFATLSDPALGLMIMVAIAIHNIPEGIAISVPIYYATGSRRKAFFYSFLSGMAEPLGAVVGFLILSQYLNGIAFGVAFGLVAGIMVFISLDELLPAAQKYGKHHYSIYGMIAGMGVMALGLLSFH